MFTNYNKTNLFRKQMTEFPDIRLYVKFNL